MRGWLALLSLACWAAAPHQPHVFEESSIGASKDDDERWLAELKRCVDAAKASKGKRREHEIARLEATGRELNDNYKAQVYLARAFLSVSQPRRALLRAERAITLAPDDKEAHVVRGLARIELGDRSGAASDARAVLEQEPDNKGAKDLLRLSQN